MKSAAKWRTIGATKQVSYSKGSRRFRETRNGGMNK